MFLTKNLTYCIYLSPMVLEHNHAGLWIHPFQDQRLPISVSVGNHGGHHGDRGHTWVKSCHRQGKEDIPDC